MKLIRYVVISGCLAGTLTCANASSGGPGPETADDEASIRKIDVAWSHSAETKDLEGAVAPYATDGSILPFNAPAATGTAAIRQVWTSLMSKPGYSLSFAPTRIVIANSKDMAWEIGTFSLKLNDAQNNLSMIPGKYVVTWKKVGGTWKVAADIFNTDN